MWLNLTGRSLRRALYSVGTLCLATLPPASSGAADPLNMVVIGGLAGVSQFAKLERPFWTDELPRLSHGRVRATVRAYDESGFRGQEMLQLMRLGVVPFGTALLAVAAGDEPELNAVDLPVMNPDMQALRAAVGRFRERLRTILLERYRVELLGVYAYPAQVLFCTKAFASLSDMAGRRVRTSSVGQSELITALGGTPVVLPFAEMTKGVRDGLVDCAITGTLSGHETGPGGRHDPRARIGYQLGTVIFRGECGGMGSHPAGHARGDPRRRRRAGTQGMGSGRGRYGSRPSLRYRLVYLPRRVSKGHEPRFGRTGRRSPSSHASRHAGAAAVG